MAGKPSAVGKLGRTCPVHSWDARGLCVSCGRWKLGTTERAIFSFWRKVKKTDGCWIWLAGKSCGYGIMRWNGYPRLAHHISLMLHGFEVPPDMGPKGPMWCHKCDNPYCVRPDHLFLGVSKDNMHDMIRKGRCVHAKLHPSQVVIIRERHRAGESVASLATDYGVRKHLIYRVVSGRTWKCVS